MNKHASALGKLAAGHKKTMSEAAKNQRKDAAKKAILARRLRISSAKMQETENSS